MGGRFDEWKKLWVKEIDRLQHLLSDLRVETCGQMAAIPVGDLHGDVLLQGLSVELHLTGDGGGSVEHDLLDKCGACGHPWCEGNCPEFVTAPDNALNRMQFNASVEGITSFLLALACAGIDVTDQRIQAAATTAMESCGNEWGN